MSKKYPVFKTVDEAYKALVQPLTSIAKRHIFNQDYAIDAVHDAFAKVSEYSNKRPGRGLRAFLIVREVHRACRRLNRFSREVCAPQSFFDESYD